MEGTAWSKAWSHETACPIWSPMMSPLVCNLPPVFFVAFAFGGKFSPLHPPPKKISSLRLVSRSLTPMFSSRSLLVSGLSFKSLIHFELTFVYGVR